MLPPCAFFGNGSSVGPQIFMIDDSISERLAIEKAWPSATILLCTFHFLQRRWTWLHDGKNGVTAHSDRLVLIKKLQNLVYASNEEFLTRYYNELHEKTPVSTKYPSFLQHIRSLWEKRHAWAHCYRTSMPIRGNNTNNYAEAGIKILKELVFSRVKAYNLVQMFSFVTEVMDIYYKKNILSLANNRVETYVALCLQGINAQKVARQDIKTTENGWYTVQSQTVRGEYYSVNTTIGFCTCLKGKDGSPCVHQAAVVIQCGEYGLNFSTSASSSARQKLAQIVLGDGAIQDAGFYSSLHQESLEGHSTCQNRNNISTDKPEFRGSQWDLIRAGASDGAENNETDCYNELPDEETCALIDSVAENLKQRLREQPLDRQLLFGSQKFVERYQAHNSIKPTASICSTQIRLGFWGPNNIEKVRQLAAWQANHCASHSCRKKKKRSQERKGANNTRKTCRKWH